MKLLLLFIVMSASSLLSAAENYLTPIPVWELGRDAIDPAAVTGKVELHGDKVTIDGTNTFSIPGSVLGKQNDYTIEFEVQRPEATQSAHAIYLVSNMLVEGSHDSNCGLALYYSPPAYNCTWLMTNGHRTAEQRGMFDVSGFAKVTLVVKDRKLMFFRNGLLLTMTDDVMPSDRPLVFGGNVSDKYPAEAYLLSHIRIYDQAIYPSGYDPSTKRMRNYSGDQYQMQRVEITDPKLPRILVVGDSISMGYRRYITEHFNAKAYVDYWVGGAWLDPKSVQGEDSATKRGWKGVLSNGPYDVVSWNAMSLHMWNGTTGRCPVESYTANMTEVVEFLQKFAPETHFIWVRCTPYSKAGEGEDRVIDTQKSQRLVMFNQLTDAIMIKHSIPMVDLYRLCETIPNLGGRDGIHWQTQAYKQMADLIIKQIEKDRPDLFSK